MRKIFVLASLAVLVVLSLGGICATNAAVIPDIKINGEDGIVPITEGEPISLTVTFEPSELLLGSGEGYLICLGPQGFKRYNIASATWVNGLAPTYQGRRFWKIPHEVPLYGLSITPGVYMFFVGVDRTLDGHITQKYLTYDTVALVVSSLPCTSWVCNKWGTCQSNGTQTCESATGQPEGCQGNLPVLTQPCVPDCTTWICRSWGTCQPNKIQTCLVVEGLPAGCQGNPPVLTQPCIPPCTSWICDIWGTCQPNGTQTCTSIRGVPDGCQGTPPVLTQSCTPPPSPPSCNAYFNPNTITVGQTSTLNVNYANQFDSQIPYSCTGDIGSWMFSVSPGTGSASRTFSPVQSQTCILTVMNSVNITSTCSAAITVNPQPVPDIQITYLPPYGSYGEMLKGIVYGVDPSKYAVIVYIEVEPENWWGPKPLWAQPLTPINADGTWQCNITTGGCDPNATRVVAFLVPKDIDTSKYMCAPCFGLPNIPEALDSVIKDRYPVERTISFAGDIWTVKSRNCPAGPGPNLFSDSESSVNVDSAGLHLRIRKEDVKWFCSEVRNVNNYGYGTYMMQTHGRVDNLDPYHVFSGFLWDPKAFDAHFREIDMIEIAKWGDPNNTTNIQNVVQPCNQCPGCGGNCQRFQIDLTNQDNDLTHYLVWLPGKIEFRTYKGHYANGIIPPVTALVHMWTYTGLNIPEPGEENFRFNFWLFWGYPPLNGQNAEILITDFSWQPGEPNW